MLILPYHRQGKEILYCIFKRKDSNIWQFIAGGGEDEDVSVLAAVKREIYEESKISAHEKYFVLETQCNISAECFLKARLVLENDCLVIPEYAFAVEVNDFRLEISDEHTEYRWVDLIEGSARTSTFVRAQPDSAGEDNSR